MQHANTKNNSLRTSLCRQNWGLQRLDLDKAVLVLLNKAVLSGFPNLYSAKKYHHFQLKFIFIMFSNHKVEKPHFLH